MTKREYTIGNYYEKSVNGKKMLLAYQGRYKDKHTFGGLFNGKHITHKEQI